MTFQEYLALDGLNWTTLKAMEDSPLAMLHRQKTPSEDTPSRVLGRATHMAILEPDRFETDVITYDSRRAGKAWEAFKESNASRTILKVSELETCQDMAAAVRGDSAAMRYLRHGRAELTIRWRDPDTGVPRKARLDWLTVHDGQVILVDLKTARDITERGMAQAAARFGYHGQLASYMDGLRVLGVRVARVVMLVVRNRAPYDVGVFELGEDALEAGWTWYRRLLDLAAKCAKEGRWPGRYDGAEQTLALPGWAPGMPDYDDEIQL